LVSQAAFHDLGRLHLAHHGDAREKAMWSFVSDQLSNYETFWQTFVVLLTNRIDPSKQFGTEEWIRVRSGLPRQYEDLLMTNYSVLYYAASAAEQMRINGALLTSV